MHRRAFYSVEDITFAEKGLVLMSDCMESTAVEPDAL